MKREKDSATKISVCQSPTSSPSESVSKLNKLFIFETGPEGPELES